MRENGTMFRNFIAEAVLCAVIYFGSFLASRGGVHILSSLLLVFYALGVYICRFRESGNLVDMKGLFALAWVGGQGIACLQLSHLQTDWSVWTWLTFFLAYIGFCAGYMRRQSMPEHVALAKDGVRAGRLLLCACGLAVASWVCFLIEFLAVGFIPLFSDKPHAYSYFHVSGVHYFTISCILIPAITVLYWKVKEKRSRRDYVLLGIANITAVAVPVLCVSRFQLLFAVGFAVVVYILTNRHLNWKVLVLLLVIMVPVYVGLTVARNHDVEYLNGIFDMKNSSTPIFITQPYIYVANNFENFNCLVEQIAEHTYGVRMLFPVFALTGLKFIFPELTASPIYITKPELTTLTMFPVYVGLTVARNHDVEYLNGIFDMKNSSTPIFITQPYIYVANNFENFNCLVEQIAEHTYGVRMLFPVFALTGLKFIFPELTASPIYITKPELTTLTMFYDAYYDFGIVGVLLLALIIGFAARKLTVWIHKGGNPVAYLFYGQIAIYLGLAFFTTWFSNPTTWFWLALTTVMYLFVGYQKKEEDGRWRKGLK